MALVIQNSLSFLLADVTRRMRRAFAKRLDGSFLTMAQARVLVYVSRHEGIRQIDLADLLDVQPITLTRLIDQLVAGGVMERRPDPRDRRAYRLHLLPPAQTHLATIEQVNDVLLADMLQGMTEQQVTDLLSRLQEMHSRLSADIDG
jgi:DNA-binding MarR family transcriptional regulator